MSQFDFPRINFNGLMNVNVGTGNNDDYSPYHFIKESFNPPKPEYIGKPMRLADSLSVQPETYGMSDEEWLDWTQNVQTFFNTQTGENAQLIPAEWNYYGGMGLTMIDVNVTEVITGGSTVVIDNKEALIGAQLSFNMQPGGNMASTGVICDVNPEAVPSSQFIASNMLLEKDGQALMSGVPSKGSTRFINFQRNVAINASGGASASVYHTISKEELSGQKILSVLGDQITGNPKFKGLMIRYNLYRSMAEINGFDYSTGTLDKLVNHYKDKQTNPAYVQITGTISPWYEGQMQSISMSRIMMPSGQFKSPGGNGQPINPPDPTCMFGLGPVTFQINDGGKRGFISLDVINTFPEQYEGQGNPLTYLNKEGKPNNPKFDLGTLTLRMATPAGVEPAVSVDIGTINNTTEFYYSGGGMVDIPFGEDLQKQYAANDQLVFQIYASNPDKVLLEEATYMIAAEHSTVYGEQDASGTPSSAFNFNGTNVPISFTVYKKGVEVNEVPEGLVIQEFDSTPNQATGTQAAIRTIDNYQPGQPISVPTPKAGNKLFYCTFKGKEASNLNGVNLLTAPIITMRVLPNEDYSQYYVDPSAEQPVANDTLTFEILYEKVLRNYYLLYPAMSKHVPLDSKDAWDGPDMARRMYKRLQMSYWPTVMYMPRTRDLSNSRRTLLQAWCLRVMKGN